MTAPEIVIVAIGTFLVIAYVAVISAAYYMAVKDDLKKLDKISK